MKIPESIKSLFYKCLPFFMGVLAFFSYSVFQARKEAATRAKDSNADDNANLQAIEQKVEEIQAATKTTAAKVEKAEAIVSRPVAPVGTIEEGVADWNRHNEK